VDWWVALIVVVRDEGCGDCQGNNRREEGEREEDGVGELDDFLGRHDGGLEAELVCCKVSTGDLSMNESEENG
jgi:hypothetical protein